MAKPPRLNKHECQGKCYLHKGSHTIRMHGSKSYVFIKLDPEPACDFDLEYCHMRHVVDCVRAHSGLQFAAVIQSILILEGI